MGCIGTHGAVGSTIVPVLGWQPPTLWRLLIVPFEATIAGSEGSTFYEATLGPFMLTLPLLLPLVWHTLRQQEKKIVLLLALFFLVNYVLWLTGVARTALLLRARFLLPSFTFTALMGAVFLDRLPQLRRPQLAVDWITNAIVTLTLALLLFATVREFIWVNPLGVALGSETQTAYYERRLGPYIPAIQAVNELPASSHTLFLFEPRTYLCNNACQPDALLDNLLHPTQGKELDSAGIYTQWQTVGYTHVLLHQDGYQYLVDDDITPFTDNDLATMRQLQADYLTPLAEFGEGSYILYAIQE